ncbi:MAG TPA: formylglycine-generating enzyme family protein [Ktedonobacterales bacterium]|nr:formylglycine-generating enzyme family protein [Ktedonobacterales bacterium]
MIIAVLLALLLAAPRASAQNAAGSVFQDCRDCPEMVVVPAGRFMMGGNEPQHVLEGPRHQVSIAAFAIGRTHVTRAQFQRFVSATGYAATSDCSNFAASPLRDGRLPRDANWPNPGFEQTDADPAVCMHFADAEAYVRWLSQHAGRPYRLPSEAEWEYAARAGTTTVRWWGDGPDGACASANARDETFVERLGATLGAGYPFPCRDGYATTSAVGSFRPNPFGLSDMLGNAWQWVADCFHLSYAGAPADGSAWVAGDCSRHVLRGGSWLEGQDPIRSTLRLALPADYRWNTYGFRVARTLTP